MKPTGSAFDCSVNERECRQLDAASLNRACVCPGFDRDQLREQMNLRWRQMGIGETGDAMQSNWLAAVPLYVDAVDIASMTRMAKALEVVVRNPAYLEAIAAWCPQRPPNEPDSPGGVLGLDFHIAGNAPPQLIEVNTNPGGLLLGLPIAQAVQACAPGRMHSPTDLASVEQRVMQVMEHEWSCQKGQQTLHDIAIVDDSPATQFLYPEFLLYRDLFSRNGYGARIAAPGQLHYHDGTVGVAGLDIDMVYNRLTDFSLEEPAHASLREAFAAGHVAVSPHPHAHALYADKRNLTLLSDRAFLQGAAMPREVVDVLLASVPTTIQLTAENRDRLWAGRRHWFFKPATGFGSRASYRGDKLTRRVWDDMPSMPYVAQSLVVPGQRHLQTDAPPLKFDVRCFAYAGEPILFLGRLYQGQTTNFRTPAGGFAPVLTLRGAT